MQDPNKAQLTILSDLPPISMLRGSRCLVTGARGVLGRAVVDQIGELGVETLFAPTRNELDLQDAVATERFLAEHRPNVVIHLAATVFGLAGNMKNQLRSIFENSAINQNIFGAIAKYPVDYFFFAGTVASYPYPYVEMPLKEEQFFNGLPHSGEFGYAMAKRHAYGYLRILSEETGMRFTYGIFTNLYGSHDRFDVDGGHVIPSLVAKAHEASWHGRPLKVWGDGSAERDFLHAKDAARAIVFCAETPGADTLVNISSGEAVSIERITRRIADEARVNEIHFEVDKPVGIKRRVVDNSRLRALGFEPKVKIDDGLAFTYKWYAENQVDIRR
ncbi:MULTISPECIES: NAD-dependent epimerase/dehydratase family protein [Rhizobium]|uniref:GDP-L-fucose synthase n=1 Tax=Rhizobium paranaense TaxID=1650438 RepID=A0A7W9D4V8_9HYPH|nr:NAD-dependent epimerase/dehydratase family protein [Rhizobium paranaense]MBB5577640.1 GDP-L-fucose synthase [Rhizobium paranaense]